MDVLEAIKKRRSIRKFKQIPVKSEDIMTIIDAGRLAAFGANRQPLKFKVIENETAKEIYPYTKWAAYLKEWSPLENERPLCYIAVLGDRNIKTTFETEAGAAISNMMLAAVELNLATCWLGALDREKIKEAIKTDYDIVYLLAVGYPDQQSEIVDIKNDDVKYYQDENGVIKVPKRTLDEVMV